MSLFCPCSTNQHVNNSTKLYRVGGCLFMEAGLQTNTCHWPLAGGFGLLKAPVWYGGVWYQWGGSVAYKNEQHSRTASLEQHQDCLSLVQQVICIKTNMNIVCSVCGQCVCRDIICGCSDYEFRLVFLNLQHTPCCRAVTHSSWPWEPIGVAMNCGCRVTSLAL